MKITSFLLILTAACSCCSASNQLRRDAEYYVAEYAQHYNVPVEFVRAIVEQESAWQQCPVSPKGAAGLMQLMPDTARRLNVLDRCDVNQNVSGGVRYLAWLMTKFDGDPRLVAAAYYVGEHTIDARRLKYSNRDVVAYVISIRERFERQKRFRTITVQGIPRRTR